ncbi:MAG: histidine kinase [Acidobacteriaceae bacterium]|nr:histidine kinase [Acidobacteriaceae bacterium]MBV9497908.1 histidine kinase [Acidobacteriaceae bacterium]
MHPLLKSWKHVLQYLSVWTVLGAMLGFMLAVAGHFNLAETVAITAPITIALAVVCLSAWFVARSSPPGSISAWRVRFRMGIAAMFASAVVLAFAHVLAKALNVVFPGLEARFLPAVPVLGGMCWLLYLLSITLHHLWIAMERSKRAELLSRESELKALKAQVNPHFLFNSLNSISALTSVDPARARDMCIRLSDFLRNSLRLGERVSIPFAEELALLTTYLEVEQVRFGQRLRIAQDFDSGCADCDVPPLLVQPLVENAIKHGIATLVDGGEIALTGRRNGQNLRVVVENPFDPDAPATRRTGFGLVSVRNRLEARYGGAARLQIEVGDKTYRVILSLPCGGKEPEHA